MSLDSLKEIFQYGNFDLIYNNLELRSIDLNSLQQIIKNIKTKDLSEGWQWRLYNNFTNLLNSYENYILINFKIFVNFCRFISVSIEHYEKIFNITSPVFNFTRKNDKDVFNMIITIFLNNIYDKLQTYKFQNNLIDEKKFYKKFEKYLSQIDGKVFFCDFTTPYDNLKWTPRFKIVYENTEIFFEGIDVYLDSYTKNRNFFYNNTMQKDIELFSERLKYIKTNSSLYFKIINTHVKEITEKMFDIFPYNILMKDYKNLMLVSEEVYRPSLLKNKFLETTSDSYIMLSIIPRFLSSYILGFPVISIDIPSEKTFVKFIEKLELVGEKKYYQFISEKFNLPKLKAVSFDVECGNGIEEDNHVDLCYNKIIDYNQDDVISLLNNNIIHYFSCKEFKSILKKKENPYNRQEFNIFYHIIENLKFKNRSKKIFTSRGLDLELNGTMLENFEELKEKIYFNKTISRERTTNQDLDLIYQPIIDMLFSSNQFNF